MSSVISVENLSKKYIISHQKRERYTALRDVLTERAKRFTQKLIHPFAVPENDPVHEEFWALKDISFNIQQGDRVGIIGRNGAGKSTLLKILSRITEPTSGRVSIKGRVASLLEVGTGFHPELTGRENIFLNGAILGMGKAEIKKKFDEIVAFAEVERFLDTPVKRYSSGMYVRLAFAVAAHLEPEILIVDEVLAVGDAQFQQKCLSKMEEVGSEGRTVMFVSHNIAAITSLCTTAILLNDGEVVKTGNVFDVAGLYTRGGGDAIVDFANSKIGDEHARLLAVTVLDENNVPASQVVINKKMSVSVTFEILKDTERELIPKFHFKADDGRYAFITAATTQMQKYASGVYQAICYIPENLLNQGTYFVDVVLVSYEPTKAIHFHEKGAISFDVIDPVIDIPTRIKGAPIQVFPGVVRPLLNWSVVELK